MRLLEVLDLGNVLGGVGELERDALAMPARWEAAASDHRHLVRHVGVDRIRVIA